MFFRDEVAGMSPHRNRREANVIEDNGRESGAAGFRVRGEPSGLAFKEDLIGDPRAVSKRAQTVGSLVEDRVGAVEFGTTRSEASPVVDDRRRESAESAPSKRRFDSRQSRPDGVAAT